MESISKYLSQFVVIWDKLSFFNAAGVLVFLLAAGTVLLFTGCSPVFGWLVAILILVVGSVAFGKLGGLIHKDYETKQLAKERRDKLYSRLAKLDTREKEFFQEALDVNARSIYLREVDGTIVGLVQKGMVKQVCGHISGKWDWLIHDDVWDALRENPNLLKQ